MAAWADELGCAAPALTAPQTTIVCHSPAFADARVAFALATTTACVVTVPADWHATARAALAPLPPADAFDPQCLAGMFGEAVQQIVGPAWQGHVDADSFTPVQVQAPAELQATRPLQPADHGDLAALAAACNPGEWEASTVDLDHPPVFGGVADGRLVAAGTLTAWRGRFWHVGIVTHPSYRRRGYGRAVASAMTRYGLDRGWLLHYQTLQANAASVTIARSLGYQQHAQTLAIRLTPP